MAVENRLLMSGQRAKGRAEGSTVSSGVLGMDLSMTTHTFSILIMHHAMYMTKVDRSILPQSILLIAARGVNMSRGWQPTHTNPVRTNTLSTLGTMKA